MKLCNYFPQVLLFIDRFFRKLRGKFQFRLDYYTCDVQMYIGSPRRLRGLAIACWTTDHYHPCSNLGVGTSEGCFIFDFASLPLGVARSI